MLDDTADKALPSVRERDCGCSREPGQAITTERALPLVPAADCGCSGPVVRAHPAPRVAPVAALRSAQPTRRGFLGRLALLPAVGVLTRFLPIGGGQSASAATCYSWKYVGCERYCDCNCSEANSYYVYRRLCCAVGCWYEYYYAGIAYCGNYCSPCGAFLGYC